MGKLTEAEAALVRLLHVFDRRHVTSDAARRHGLEDEFHLCRKAGMLVHAGYETSGRAEEWLDSPIGRAALAQKDTDNG